MGGLGVVGGFIADVLNEKDPYAIPDNFMPFFKVGDDVKSMAVQITYADGSQSVVREFRRQ